MSVRPIDIKTNIMGNDEASRLRENQKAQEAGLAENLAQNKNAQNQKTDSVQKTETTEGKIIRKEDEESEKKNKSNASKSAKDKDEKQEEEEIKHPQIPDGKRGFKIDIKV
ncbi:MAG TPA: hypothetical protein DCG57_18805 [Candidatus Riflebacteria bacterium]|jgi:hypothetical protein|nr:hypothetical protein [Candidatus Riflebacteria bacterium]